MTDYPDIQVAGGDTATPVNLQKRVRFISGLCDLRSVRFLDCGCGAGEYVFALRDWFGTDAWGIEYSPEKVLNARSHPRHGARVKQGDLQHLEEPEAAYDVVLLNEVIEHVPDEAAALNEVNRVIKPGGLLIVFSPNRWFPFETHGINLRSSGRRLPPSVPFVPYIPVAIGRRFFDYWARNYWPHELRSLVREAGFTPCELGYFWQTFENISGQQPALVRRFKPFFRAMAAACERTPILRRFGTSQVIAARKA
jgi:SAM-dependent methyltransferase